MQLSHVLALPCCVLKEHQPQLMALSQGSGKNRHLGSPHVTGGSGGLT